MALHLKALSGPFKDKSFPLKVGFVVGRTEGDLIVNEDLRLSGRHAFVEALDDGQWQMVDNKSKNGLRVDDTLFEKVPLEIGKVILIGTYYYEVTDEKLSEEAAQAAAQAKSGHARHWREILTSQIENNLTDIKNEGRAIAAFHPSIVLDFIRGPQAETRWVLSYGPRSVGSRSLDFPIFEPNAPEVCFVITPSPDGITFQTDHPDLVTLNGRSVSTEILHIADIIKIQDTEIEVDFIE